MIASLYRNLQCVAAIFAGLVFLSACAAKPHVPVAPDGPELVVKVTDDGRQCWTVRNAQSAKGDFIDQTDNVCAKIVQNAEEQLETASRAPIHAPDLLTRTVSIFRRGKLWCKVYDFTENTKPDAPAKAPDKPEGMANTSPTAQNGLGPHLVCRRIVELEPQEFAKNGWFAPARLVYVAAPVK